MVERPGVVSPGVGRLHPVEDHLPQRGLGGSEGRGAPDLGRRRLARYRLTARMFWGILVHAYGSLSGGSLMSAMAKPHLYGDIKRSANVHAPACPSSNNPLSFRVAARR